MLTNIPTVIAGNLTHDPELRFTESGRAVVSFTVASTPRVQRGGEWTDGETTFLRAEAWGPIAENVAESFKRGHRVVAVGHLRTETWTDRESGDKRSALRLTCDEVAGSVQYATVQVRKAERGAAGVDGPRHAGERFERTGEPVTGPDGE